jgi:hypothetical protein
MALEAAVGQQSSHIRMADKDHAVEIVGLALEAVAPGHADD